MHGTRTLGYNNFGEQETDSLLADGVTHLITELRDEFGRSVGYTYAKNGAVQQTVSTGYGDDGRINTAGFVHGGEMKQFGYTYLAGSNLLQVLNKPSGMSLTHTYEATRDLLTGIAYHRGSTLVAQRTYSYDTLGRPTARHTARQGSVVNDTFTHNNRSELVAATVNGTNYEYAYDNIGNRTSATEGDEVTGYASNELNQYTMIRRSAEDFFVPEFDADGNQYHIQTETGDWALNYNAANRPTDFSCMDEEGNFLTVKCDYDSMGRRVFKKVISGTGTVISHQRFIYRGYLQIACVDLTRTNHPALWLITWDPTQPVATRPLAIQKDGTWYTYGLDLTKNVCEVFGATGYIRTAYTYSPYGSVTAIGNVTQPIQWSSEFNDEELGLVYYNWRYYSSAIGNWMQMDFIMNKNMYTYCFNNVVMLLDNLGLAATQEEIERKNYNFAIRKRIQLNDKERNYTDHCQKNWLLFGSHTYEALKFIHGKHRDNFGEVNINWFERIAIMSCAPDLINSLLPKSKRFETLTEVYIPPIHHLPENIQRNYNYEPLCYIIPRNILREYMTSAGFEFGIEYHNRVYYQIPGEEIHNELKNDWIL